MHVQRTDQTFSIYISYLEIYNEAGYDLLDPSQDTKALEELPCVACPVARCFCRHSVAVDCLP